MREAPGRSGSATALAKLSAARGGPPDETAIQMIVAVIVVSVISSLCELLLRLLERPSVLPATVRL